ncbi:MAG: hypothetical protein QXW21_05495 [Candidatus Methanomethylicaceae archaeon]
MNFENLLKLLENERIEKITPIIKYGEHLGYIIEGWHIEDYIDYAIGNMGFESIVIWGPMGTLKSNFAMQLAYHVYNDWDLVLERIILTPEELIKLYSEVAEQKNKRIPLIILDDITTIFPKQLWFINKQLFSKLQQLTSVVRTQISCIIVTTPLPERVISPLAEIMKNEITTYPNKSLIINRYMWLPSKQPMKSRFKKVAIEERRINMYDVPTEVFMKYDEKRRIVAREILEETEEAQRGGKKGGSSKILEMSTEKILEKIREKGIKIRNERAREIINAIKEIDEEERAGEFF